MSPRGYWEQAIFMDYPKDSGPRHGLGIPLVPRSTRMALTTVKMRSSYQIVGVQIHFLPEGPVVKGQKGEPIQVLTVKLEDEYRLFEHIQRQDKEMKKWLHEFPEAWAETAGMGRAKFQPPVHVELKAQAFPIAVQQYPMPNEARDGMRLHIQCLLKLDIQENVNLLGYPSPFCAKTRDRRLPERGKQTCS